MFLLFSNLISTAASETYVWENTPKVQVCDQHVNEREVIESINWWQEELDLGPIEVEFNSSCDHQSNVIQISRNKTYTEDYGKTKLNFFYYKNKPDEKILTDAKIVLSDHMIRKDNITLRHELGHAFGLLHESHGIMKPYW